MIDKKEPMVAKPIDIDVYQKQMNEFLEGYKSKTNLRALFNSIIAEIESKQILLENFTAEDWNDVFIKRDYQQTSFNNMKWGLGAFLKKYKYITTFEELSKIENTKVRKYFSSIDELILAIRERLDNDERLTNYAYANYCEDKIFISSKYSSAICLSFLLWIGLSVDECVNLSKNQVDLENRIIMINNREVSFDVHEVVSRFIEWYYKQDEILMFYRNSIRTYTLESDYLIRSFKGQYSQQRMVKILIDILGLNVDLIYDSRMYSSIVLNFKPDEITLENVSQYIMSRGFSFSISRAKAKDFVRAYQAK